MDDFSKNNSKKDGLQPQCRKCISDWHKEQYSKHKKYYLEKAKIQHSKDKNRNYKESARFSHSKSRALKLCKGWTITKKDYIILIRKNCFYCNNELGKHKTCGVGLDRIDNKRGYDLDNVISCCGICNSIRNDFLTVEETTIAVRAILIFRKGKLILDQ